MPKRTSPLIMAPSAVLCEQGLKKECAYSPLKALQVLCRIRKATSLGYVPFSACSPALGGCRLGQLWLAGRPPLPGISGTGP